MKREATVVESGSKKMLTLPSHVLSLLIIMLEALLVELLFMGQM